MEEKCLHKEEPKCDREHCPYNQGKQFSRSRVAESCESGEAERAEISQSSQTGQGDGADSCVGAAQHLKAAGRSAANSSFPSQMDDGEISCFRHTKQRHESS